jgi:uncharacterized protein (DUF2236 family)
VNVLKQHVANDLFRQTGRHDEPHIFGGAPGDPGLTGPGSASWKINSDLPSVMIAGMGAIIMEILHPSVMAGVQDLSSYQEQPLRRGRTTFGYVVTTTFANTQAARRLINTVKRMHGRVSGTRPDGVPYRALDPELIGWVHTCIPWAIMEAYQRFKGPLAIAERDRYLREQAVIGRMGGAEQIPETVADLEDYLEMMRPKLSVNHQTLQFFEFLMTMPFGMPMPGPLSRPVHRFQIEAGMSLMPDWARDLTGFDPPELARRVVHHRVLGAYARLSRWAVAEPPWVTLARERAAFAHSGGPRPRPAHGLQTALPSDITVTEVSV